MRPIDKMTYAVEFLGLYGTAAKEQSHKDFTLYLQRSVIFRYDNLCSQCVCSECQEFLQDKPIAEPKDYPKAIRDIADRIF